MNHEPAEYPALPGPRGGPWRGVLAVQRVLAVTLALALAAAGVYLGQRVYVRTDVSGSDYYRLSPKTLSLLAAIERDVAVTAIFEADHELARETRNLLAEYQAAADALPGRRLRVTFLDPDRDLAAVRDLAREEALPGANLVLFACEDRRKVVDARQLADYDYGWRADGGVRKTRTAFRAEQAFSSALQSVAVARRPVVYFVRGHGERDLQDFSAQTGYSLIHMELRRDNLDVRGLVLNAQQGVPADADAVVVAGPRRPLAAEEVALLQRYLARSGRVLLLLEAGVVSGLEGLCQTWGVKIGDGFVVGPSLRPGYRELILSKYGDHPITRSMAALNAVFFRPRPVEAREFPDRAADRPVATVLAYNTDEGWVEHDQAEESPRFDPATDRRGPVGVAAAVERGGASGVDTALAPSRLVVLGDAAFAANGGLRVGGAGNRDLLLNALNWLVAREQIMAIGARAPMELRPGMSDRQWRQAYLLIALALPGLVAVTGVLVWWRRRR